jgi:hypothetical protein
LTRARGGALHDARASLAHAAVAHRASLV